MEGVCVARVRSVYWLWVKWGYGMGGSLPPRSDAGEVCTQPGCGRLGTVLTAPKGLCRFCVVGGLGDRETPGPGLPKTCVPGASWCLFRRGGPLSVSA